MLSDLRSALGTLGEVGEGGGKGEQMIEKFIGALRMDFHETDIYTVLGESP